MSTNLKEVLTQIKTEKDTKLIPQDIKSGITIFDVTGTYEGIDTSDATATAADMVLGKTAYVRGSKVVGAIEDLREGTQPLQLHTLDTNYHENVLEVFTNPVVNYKTGSIITETTNLPVSVPFNVLASEIGLTADVIKKDVTILGITGTYDGENPGGDGLVIHNGDVITLHTADIGQIIIDSDAGLDMTDIVESGGYLDKPIVSLGTCTYNNTPDCDIGIYANVDTGDVFLGIGATSNLMATPILTINDARKTDQQIPSIFRLQNFVTMLQSIGNIVDAVTLPDSNDVVIYKNPTTMQVKTVEHQAGLQVDIPLIELGDTKNMRIQTGDTLTFDFQAFNHLMESERVDGSGYLNTSGCADVPFFKLCDCTYNGQPGYSLALYLAISDSDKITLCVTNFVQADELITILDTAQSYILPAEPTIANLESLFGTMATVSESVTLPNCDIVFENMNNPVLYTVNNEFTLDGRGITLLDINSTIVVPTITIQYGDEITFDCGALSSSITSLPNYESIKNEHLVTSGCGIVTPSINLGDCTVDGVSGYEMGIYVDDTSDTINLAVKLKIGGGDEVIIPIFTSTMCCIDISSECTIAEFCKCMSIANVVSGYSQAGREGNITIETPTNISLITLSNNYSVDVSDTSILEVEHIDGN